MKFADTLICKSGKHCEICRSVNRGAKWREMMAGQFEMPDACPSGRPMIEDGPGETDADCQPDTQADTLTIDPAAKPPKTGEWSFVHQRQEVCLKCERFNQRKGNCIVRGVTNGPCFRKRKSNRCPLGKW